MPLGRKRDFGSASLRAKRLDQRRLATPSAAGKRGSGCPERWHPQPFPRELAAIAPECAGRQRTLGQVHAAPGAPRPDFRPRPAHAAGKVLEMPHRIAEETRPAVRRPPEDPNQGRIRGRMPRKNRIIRPEFGHPGLVELQDSLCRLAGNPERLGVAQRVHIKSLAPVRAMSAGMRVVERGGHGRKQRTGRIHAGEHRFSPRRRQRKDVRVSRLASAGGLPILRGA